MVRQTYNAVFENGAFRPLGSQTVPIPEGHRVRLTVESDETTANVLDLAFRVYEGLTDEQIAQVEHIAFDRRDFFSAEPNP